MNMVAMNMVARLGHSASKEGREEQTASGGRRHFLDPQRGDGVRVQILAFQCLRYLRYMESVLSPYNLRTQTATTELIIEIRTE